MLSLRMLRLFARRWDCARRHTAARRAAARRVPRLSFECLETRDLLAGSFGMATLPLPAPIEHDSHAFAAPPRVDTGGPMPGGVTVNAAFIGDADRGPALLAALDDERLIIIVVDMPPPRGIDGLLHDVDHSTFDHVPVTPALAGEVTSLDRPALGIADSPATAGSHPSAGSAAVAVDGPHLGNITVPLYFTQLVPSTPPSTLIATPVDNPMAVHLVGGPDTVRAAGQDAFAVGVPGPAQVAAYPASLESNAALSTSTGPLGVPWLAGVLTPVAELDGTQTLFALERFVGEAQSWGQTLASKLASLLASPWTAGVAVAVAAVEICRRRAQRAPRPEESALDVPTITGPSQLI